MEEGNKRRKLQHQHSVDAAHRHKVCSKLEQLWRDSKFIDLKLQLVDEHGTEVLVLGLHKTTACLSPVLEVSLVSDFMPPADDTIALCTDTIHPVALLPVVQYLYSGELDLERETVGPILAACSYLGLLCAKQLCVEYLSSHLSEENALSTVRIADLHFESDLKEKPPDLWNTSLRVWWAGRSGYT